MSLPIQVPIGAATTDQYRLTPRELFELGKWHYERKEMAATAKHLNQLVKEWKLKLLEQQEAGVLEE